MDQATRARHVQRALAALTELRERLLSPRTRFRERGKVQQAVDHLLADCEVESLVRVRIEEREDAQYRQAQPGRPSKHTKYKKETRPRSAGKGTILNDDTTVSVSDASMDEGSRQFTSLGTFVTRAANGNLSAASGMAWGPDGNLHVGSMYTHEILKFDGATGALLATFVAAGTGGPESPATQGSSFRPDGKLYVLCRDKAQVLRF